MRIGMMADLYKPHISGVTNYIALSKRYLERAGHEVFVFTFGNKDIEDDEPNIIRSAGLPTGFKGYYFNLSYSQQARRLLQTMDVVHVHHPFISGSLALLYCKPKGIPIVFTNHTRYDLYAHAYVPVLGELVSGIATEGYLPVFCRSCDLVISPSAGVREILFGFGVDVPIQVVPNGVDILPFQSPISKVPRSELQLSDDDVVFYYIGRLGVEKNLTFLLQAFAAAVRAYERIHLVLVGVGPEQAALQSWVKENRLDRNISFTGLIPYEQLPCYLAMADAFVTASVTEVHPLTVIEAMAAGLPVLAIQSPGTADTIHDGVNGYLCEKEDLAFFTAKLMRLAIEHEKRLEMGRNASKSAENYAIERTTQLMLEQYQSVIKSVSGRERTSRFRRAKPAELK